MDCNNQNMNSKSFLSQKSTNMQYQSTLDTFQTTNHSEMSPKSTPKTYQTSTSSLEDFLAKHSVLLEKEKDLTIQEEHYFLKSQGFSKTKDPDIFYSKTLKAYLVMTMEKLSRQYLKFSPTYGIMYNGKCIIQKITASHKTENVCLLKDILETNVDPKYYCSEELIRRLM